MKGISGSEGQRVFTVFSTSPSRNLLLSPRMATSVSVAMVRVGCGRVEEAHYSSIFRPDSKRFPGSTIGGYNLRISPPITPSGLAKKTAAFGTRHRPQFVLPANPTSGPKCVTNSSNTLAADGSLSPFRRKLPTRWNICKRLLRIEREEYGRHSDVTACTAPQRAVGMVM